MNEERKDCKEAHDRRVKGTASAEKSKDEGYQKEYKKKIIRIEIPQLLLSIIIFP